MSEHLTNIVVVGLLHREGKIFVARRSDTKQAFPGQFELPGGHVDPGETLVTALAREIKEELQVEVKVGEIIHAFTYHSENMDKVEICYLCTIPEGIEPIFDPDDHSEARWIGSNEIHLFEKEDDETEALKKAFKRLEGEQ